MPDPLTRQKAYATPALAGLFTSFQVNVPQVYVDVDREKAKRQGIDLGDLFETLGAGHLVVGGDFTYGAGRSGNVETLRRAAERCGAKVHVVPNEVENYVAREKLASMGISIDELTTSQKKYMSGWEQGT